MNIQLSRRNLLIAGAIVIVVVVLVVVTILSSGGNKPSASTNLVRPINVYPGPSNAVSGTAPNANDDSWVLVNTGSAANLQLFNLQKGNKTLTVPVSADAQVVTTGAGGTVALGLNTGTGGAVEFFSSQGFQSEGTVAVSGPVLDLVAGSDGVTFYALIDVHGADSVSVINERTLKVISVVPMPSTSLSIAVSPDKTIIYSLQADGRITLIGTQTGAVQGSLPAAAGGRQVVLSVDGSTLYVLKGSLNDDNVSVIDVATESTAEVLPAPEYTRWIAPSLNGELLIDFVGSSSVGNIQTFSTNR